MPVLLVATNSCYIVDAKDAAKPHGSFQDYEKLDSHKTVQVKQGFTKHPLQQHKRS